MSNIADDALATLERRGWIQGQTASLDGDIGEDQREYEYEPIEVPPDEREEPEVSPAEVPEPEPEKVPA